MSTLHANAPVVVLATGDLIIDEPEPDGYFEPARAALQAADLVVGHVEVPFTLEREGSLNIPLEARDPRKLGALKRAGIHLTPRESWAGGRKAGGAYVHILTSHELDHATPGGTPTVYTGAEAESLEHMCDDIRRLRARTDVVMVSMHKGTVHVPGLVMAYEKQVAHAAIDAGADVVLGHHAHLLRGIEVYKGKAIYHGLGNFVTVTHALSPIGVTDPDEWALKRLKLFGFVPDPETPEYPFHPESRHAMLAKCVIAPDGSVHAGYVACRINRRSQPEVTSREESQAVFDYVDRITREAGFDTRFEWRGDEVAISAGGATICP